MHYNNYDLRMVGSWPDNLDQVLAFIPFATQGRYPGFDDPVTRMEEAEAIGMAEKVIMWAKCEIAQIAGAENNPPQNESP